MKSPQDVAAIGRFQVVEVLWKGANGVVYLARDEHGSLVSIKTLPNSQSADPVSVGRLRSEARALEQLRHPNVVSLLEVDTDPVLGLFLVMDYAPGRTLRAVLDEQEFLDPETAGIVAQQICEALEAAHQEGIIHRDITPESVIIGEDYTVTVTDFGVAKLTESSGLTLPGVIPGHPEYMSPEQASGLAQLDQCSDIYACGVVLYEMLTGSVPFHGPTSFKIMQLQMFQEPEPPRSRRPHIPQKLEAIVLRALQKEPGDRFPTAGAMAKELEIWLRYIEENPLPEIPRTPREPAAAEPPPLPPSAAAHEPKAGDRLEWAGRALVFAESPSQEGTGVAHSMRGDHSTVYRLSSPMGGQDQALKVFARDDLRVKEVPGLAGCLWAASGLQGLQVLERTVLDPDDAGTADLLRDHPSLRYAVLMPWIGGPQWSGVVYHKYRLSQEESTTFGKALLELLSALEVMNLAHCNLSAANLLLPLLGADARPGSSAVELVDLEQMYAPGLARPIHRPSSAPGYVRRAADGSAPWAPSADRRPGGLLVAEILTWWHPEVADAAWGETLFNPREIGTDCPRYHAVLKALEHDWGQHAALTFHACWTSATDAECPDFQEWWEALRPPVPGAVAPAPPLLPPQAEPEPEAWEGAPPFEEAAEPEPAWEEPVAVAFEEPVAVEEPAPVEEPVAFEEPVVEEEPLAEEPSAPRGLPVLRKAGVAKPGGSGKSPTLRRAPAPRRMVYEEPLPTYEAAAVEEPFEAPLVEEPAVLEEPPVVEELPVEAPPPVVQEPRRRELPRRPSPPRDPVAEEAPASRAAVPEEAPAPRARVSEEAPAPRPRLSEEAPAARPRFSEEAPTPRPEPASARRAEPAPPPARPAAAGSAGSSSSPAIEIRVQHPAPDSTLSGSSVEVEGILEYRTPITFFTVRANGRQIRLSAEEFSEITRTGRFAVRVPLEPGENTVEIVANGKGGANGRTTFALRAGGGSPEPAAAAETHSTPRPDPAPTTDKGDAVALVLLFLSLVPGLGVLTALASWVLWFRGRTTVLLVSAGAATALAAIGVGCLVFFWDELRALLPL